MLSAKGPSACDQVETMHISRFPLFIVAVLLLPASAAAGPPSEIGRARDGQSAGSEQAAPPQGPPPVRVGGSIRMPVKTREVAPVYPAIAQSARVQGVVILETIVGADGKVVAAKVVRSIPLLDQAALDAVRQWEFVPTIVNGTATPVIMTTTVSFTLPGPAGSAPGRAGAAGAAPPPPARGAGNPSAPSAAGLSEALRNIRKYVEEQSFTDSGNDGRASIQVETFGVDFAPWIRRFVAQVRGNWFVPTAVARDRGRVVVAFSVLRDGRISDLKVVEPSGIALSDMASLRAIAQSNPTLPLPADYPRDSAAFTVTFYYNENPAAR
jgi:protein TonB